MTCTICHTDKANIEPKTDNFPICVDCVDDKVSEIAQRKKVETKAPRTIYHRIYDKLQPILTALGDADYATMVSKGFMDLHIDKLYTTQDGTIRISLAHNYKQNGDVMADPDMEISIYPDRKMAEAMTFQQDGAIPLYQEVYIERDGKKLVNVTLKNQLNRFLNSWLGNLKKQGFLAKFKI